MKFNKESYFAEILDRNKDLVARVCRIYSSATAPFEDLYQEVLINIWTGLDSFRGESKLQTWLYRTAINACITWHRRNNRHAANLHLADLSFDIVQHDDARADELQSMYAMIEQLEPVEKAIVMMWLDENSYEEIAAVIGISKTNVAVKLHRIKEKLIKSGNN